MYFAAQEFELILKTDETLVLSDAKGVTIKCTQGSAWITEHNLSADVVLMPDELMQISNNGKVVICPVIDNTLLKIINCPRKSVFNKHDIGSVVMNTLRAKFNWFG